MRLDVYLTVKKLCKSRAEAQSLIRSGAVTAAGKIVTKCSFDVVDENVEITGERLRYVGRGGLKLEAAIKTFGIDISGKNCLDIGASTGGFTDCMLQNGAARVTALDVGRAQLAEKLRGDSRVLSLENTDIREYFPDEKYDFIGCDVSFISLKLVLPHIFRLLQKNGGAVVLIKPQFEAGKKALSKRGVVRDEKTRLFIAKEIKEAARTLGFSALGTEISPITGGEGNVEYLLYLGKGEGE